MQIYRAPTYFFTFLLIFLIFNNKHCHLIHRPGEEIDSYFSQVQSDPKVLLPPNKKAMRTIEKYVIQQYKAHKLGLVYSV